MKEDIDKVIKGWERCLICSPSILADEESKKAYLECKYTTGLYCRRDKLINDTIKLLKEVKQNDVS